MRAQVWSSGGGVQSTAIAALIVSGELPVPDCAVIADTNFEVSTTWDYLETVVRPALEMVNVDLHRVRGLQTVGLLSGAEKKTIVMPMYSPGEKRERRLPKYCSNEWKTRPIQRFLRQRGIKSADFWIGYTTDEMERCRVYDDSQRWNHRYPLIDMRLSRSDCYAIIRDAGWPEPPRSACYMCPMRNDSEWRDLKQNSPRDFGKAVRMERSLQELDDVYFHDSCKPLNEARFDSTGDLFAKNCNAAGCFT